MQNKIIGSWSDIAQALDIYNNIMGSVPPGSVPGVFTRELMDIISSKMIKLSKWNELAAEGIIPVALEVGEYKNIGYNRWAYDVNIVAAQQPSYNYASQSQQPSYNSAPQSSYLPTVPAAQPMVIVTPQSTTPEDAARAVYARYLHKGNKLNGEYFGLLIQNYKQKLMEFEPLALLLPFLGVKDNNLSEAVLHKGFTSIVIVAFSIKNLSRDVFKWLLMGQDTQTLKRFFMQSLKDVISN